MPDVIQLGPVLVKMSVLAVAVAIVLAFAAVSLRLRRQPMRRRTVLETASSSLLVAFWVWKFSYALFYPAKVIAQPVVLLYFNGGDRGFWLALLAAVAYLRVRARKGEVPAPVWSDAIAIGGLTGWGAWHAFTWGVEGQAGAYYLQQTAIAIVFLLPVIRKGNRTADAAFWLQLVAWFGVSQMYAGFFSPDYLPVAAGLSKAQVLYAFVSLLMVILAGRSQSVQEREKHGIDESLERTPPARSWRWRQRNAILAVAALACLLGWGAFTQGTIPVQPATQAVGIQKGDLAPEIDLQTLEGKPLKLSDLRGKIVILNLWATWCPPCRAEMPDMQDFYEANKEKGVAILSVNLTSTEKSAQDVAAFVRDHGIAFPVVLDVDKQAARQYLAISIPTSYVIDSSGVIREKWIGPMDLAQMEKLVSAAE